MKKILVKCKKNGKYIKSRITIKKENFDEQQQQTFNLDTSVTNVVSTKEGIEGKDENSQNISFLEEKKNKIVLSLLQETNVMKTDENVVMIKSESLTNILEKNAITIRWCKLCNLIVRYNFN